MQEACDDFAMSTCYCHAAALGICCQPESQPATYGVGCSRVLYDCEPRCRIGNDNNYISNRPDSFPGYFDEAPCPVQCGSSDGQYYPELLTDGDLSSDPALWRDEDCDGLVGEPDALLSDLDCSDGNEDGVGLANQDNGAQECALQCGATAGMPVILKTRAAFIGPHEDVRIASGISPEFDLAFDRVWDSALSDSDVLAGAAPTLFGPGWRSAFGDRLSLASTAAGAGNVSPGVVTWLHSSGATRFRWEGQATGANVLGEDGSGARISRELGRCEDGRACKIWKLVSRDGDLLEFWEGPNTEVHPWSSQFHARLRFVRPAQMPNVRISVEHEQDLSSSDDACDALLDGADGCKNSRGLLVRAAQEWNDNGIWRRGRSLELKYVSYGGAKRLKEIRAGATREDGAGVEVLSQYSYLSDGRLEAVWEGRGCTIPTPSTTNTGCLRYRFSYDAALPRAITEVKTSVAASSTVATVESFSWTSSADSRLQVVTHRSRRTDLSFVSSTGGQTVSWQRNGANESTAFDPLGNPTACDSYACGDPTTTNEYEVSLSGGLPAYTIGQRAHVTRDGRLQYRRFDFDTGLRDSFMSLGTVLLEAEIVPSSAGADISGMSVSLDGAGSDFDTVTLSAGPGEVRSLIRRYPQSSLSAWPRAVARLSKSSQVPNQTSFNFPAPGHGGSGWFYSGAEAGRGAISVLPQVNLDGSPVSFDVTVIDRDSDNGNIINEDTDVLPVIITRAQRSGGEDRFLRTTITRDAWGRPTSILESSEDGTLSRVDFEYEPIDGSTSARMRGRLKAVKRFPDPASTAGSFYDWQACDTRLPYDALGLVTCREQPQSPTSLVTEISRTVNVGDGSRLWLTQHKEGLGGPVRLTEFQKVVGNELPLAHGVGDGDSTYSEAIDGNYVELVYLATGDARVDGQISRLRERTSSAAIFSSKFYSYDGYGYPDQVDTHGPTSTDQLAQFDYDLSDGSLMERRDYETSTTYRTTSYRYDLEGRLDSIVEPDLDAEDWVYGTAGAAYGRPEVLNRADTETASPFRMWRRIYDRDGNITSINSGTDFYVIASYVYDDFGQMMSENLLSAGVGRTYSYDGLGRVSRVQTGAAQKDVGYFRDGLGRTTEVRDLNANTPIFNYAYDEVKTPTTCTVNGRVIALTNSNSRGRLSIVGDSAGTSFYEYDLLGRVTSVIRHEGAGFACANLVATDYEWGQAGELKSIRYPSGRKVEYRYDGPNHDMRHPYGVTVYKGTDGVSSPETLVSSVEWSPLGAPRKWRWGGLSTQERQVGRDLMGRVTSIVSNYANLPNWQSLAYTTYDGDGDVLTETDSSGSSGYRYTILRSALVTSPVTNTYAPHVRHDKLMTWNHNGSALSAPLSGTTIRRESLSVDDTVYTATYPSRTAAWEQQLTQDHATLLSPAYEVELRYNSIGEVIEVNKSDSSGSVTQVSLETTPAEVVLTHGPLGNVTSAEVSSGVYTYEMDHDMRRVRKVFPSTGDERYRYGVGGQLLDQKKTTSVPYPGIQNQRTEYIWLGADVAGLLHSVNGSATTLYHVHADRMGVPRQYSTATGGRVRRLVLDAFGASVVTDDNGSLYNPPMDMRYPGQMFDSETGLIHNRWRTLVTQTGTYTSPEPLHAFTTQVFHGPQAFSYAAGSPQRYVDADGRHPLILAGILIGIGFGFGNDETDANLLMPAAGGVVGRLGLAAYTPTRAWLAARLAPFYAALDRANCGGPDIGRRTRDVAEVFRRLDQYHGIPEHLASERLHALKDALGLGGADNLLFDLTGNVFDPLTGEWLGSLTEGGGG